MRLEDLSFAAIALYTALRDNGEVRDFEKRFPESSYEEALQELRDAGVTVTEKPVEPVKLNFVEEPKGVVMWRRID